MSDKFHNKYHRYNHHSDSTGGIADSTKDAIASEEYPFRGNFYLSGDMPIIGEVEVFGSIDVNNNEILNSNGTETKVGVVRYSTSSEITSEPYISEVAIAPKDLDVIIQRSVGHQIEDPSFHVDVNVSGVSNSETLTFDGTSWINVPETGILKTIYYSSSDAEASGVSGVALNNVYITPKQLHTEIRRQMPTYGADKYILEQNSYTPNSLNFTRYQSTVGWLKVQNVIISYWTGTNWVDV